jgi:hypothetical protein
MQLAPAHQNYPPTVTHADLQRKNILVQMNSSEGLDGRENSEYEISPWVGKMPDVIRFLGVFWSLFRA